MFTLLYSSTFIEFFGLWCIKYFWTKIKISPNFSVTLGCGATTSDNCTYFTSQNVMAGNCQVRVKGMRMMKLRADDDTNTFKFPLSIYQVEICPANDNICQVGY